jgi:PD-(D/E)XK nuclease superfamily
MVSPFKISKPSLPRQVGKSFRAQISVTKRGKRAEMVYSHTQIAQFLRCPRSYRYRYLDGWREKEARAAMVFGRCFERALSAYFLRQDCTAVLFKEWGAFRDARFDYKSGESWDRLAHQGVRLLERFAQDDRVQIPCPQKDLQLKLAKTLASDNQFVAYIDALGLLDGKRCLIDWKTTTSRYAEEPEGLLSLDGQLTCYAWISGIPEVALVVFVRKNRPEIQYLKAMISDEQRRDYGRLVETTIHQIESAEFPLRSGIRFPQNGCVSCSHLGLCLGNPELVRTNLVRKPGGDGLGWLDELVD